MARHIGVSIDGSEKVYRGVILFLYPGVHTRTLKTYTTADGTEYFYHEANAYGPYGTRAPATAQVTQGLRHHEEWTKRGHYTTQRVWNPATRDYDVIQKGSVPEVVGFVEEQIPSWQLVPGTIKEA